MTPSLVMIPGFMCDARLFGPQIEAFGQGLDVHVLCADAASVTVASMADGILARAPSVFALLGLSMGAIVAMEIARQAPDRVTHLALFDCNSMPDTAASSAERMRQIDLVQAGGLTGVMRTDHIPKYAPLGQPDLAIVRLCQDMAEACGAEAFVNHQRALIARPDQRPGLAFVSCPTLVGCGAHDHLCPPANHEAICDIVPGARLAIIPGAGHLPTLQQPMTTNRIITEWLDVSPPDIASS